MSTQSELYESVTARIIAALESGAAPWIRPWKSDGTGGALPHNATTGRAYHGINTILLWGASCAYGSNGWLTFKQCQARGGHVRAGEKGTQIVFWKFFESKEKDDDGKARKIPMLRTYYVFNIAQCDDLQLASRPRAEPIGPTELDAAIALIGADIRYGGDAACFSPAGDFIAVPNREAFKSLAHYHATLLHELTHWSGHKARLDRDLSGRFGNAAYAAEELIAEIGSAFLCASLGQPLEQLQHADYVASWIKVLKDDSRAIFTAAKAAQTAADYLLGAMGRGESADDESEQLEVAA